MLYEKKEVTTNREIVLTQSVGDNRLLMNKDSEALREVVKNFIAGAAARATSGSMMFPVDVVKTRMQMQNRNVTKVLYDSGIDCFRKIVQQEGIFALYSGLVFRLTYMLPAAAFSFTMYEILKKQLTKTISTEDHKTYNGAKLVAVTLFAGGAARGLATLIRSPFDLMKQRMQVQGMASFPKRSVMEQLKYSVRHKDFFNGYLIALYRDAPFSAIYFSVYEIVKRYLKGAVAGSVATTFTIPIDVIKTRIQTDPTRYSGIRVAARATWNEGGWKGFTKGLGPRLIYLIPAASLTFMFYEKFKLVIYHLDTKNKRKNGKI